MAENDERPAVPIHRQEDARRAVEDPPGADVEPQARGSGRAEGAPHARTGGGDPPGEQVDASADPTLE